MLYIYKTIKNPSLANVFLQFCMSLLMWPQFQIFLLYVLIVLFFFRGVDSNFLCPCVIHLFATQHHPNLFYAFCLMCQLFSEFLPSIVLRPFLTTELEKKKGEREEYVNTKENLSLIYYLNLDQGNYLYVNFGLMKLPDTNLWRVNSRNQAELSFLLCV